MALIESILKGLYNMVVFLNVFKVYVPVHIIVTMFHWVHCSGDRHGLFNVK